MVEPKIELLLEAESPLAPKAAPPNIPGLLFAWKLKNGLAAGVAEFVVDGAVVENKDDEAVVVTPELKPEKDLNMVEVSVLDFVVASVVDADGGLFKNEKKPDVAGVV